MDFFDINKNAWNLKTDIHLESEFYNQEAFLRGENTLKDIELGLLGDVKGKSILHLQCHFGQDSLSLSRMGAQVTGVDLSDRAIEVAQQVADQLQLKTKFVCCNVYDTPQHIDEKFDIVFTSYGTIGWLPDIGKWAEVVGAMLKPGGRFVFVDFHPVVWMYDNDFTFVQYSYFNQDAIIEDNTGSYADKEASIQYKTVGWNHGMAEVMQALLDNGMQMEHVKEYNYSPYSCFPSMNEVESGKFELKAFGDKIPMMYSLVMVRK
jgi:2-polyprenyl-3-methyl-5-hydroxy-6-metoxy-1,4-benzoquinol methylase